MKPRPHVALIVETSKGFGRGLLRGISRYARAHGPWSIYVDERGPADPPPSWLRDWDGHGLIVRLQTREMLNFVRRMKLPAVDTLRQFDDHGLPAIYTDDEAISRAAAAHLLTKGFQHFGFVGVECAHWSDLRCDAFVQAIRKAGFECHVYEPISRRRFRASWEGGQDDLSEWVQELPKPAGLMAAHDLRALCILDACRRTETAVPERVAIVGVDNDEVLCDLADPPLSSVPHDLDRLGHEAALLLDGLMGGAPAPRGPRFVQPLAVIARQSTDIVAIEDPVVASAMRFIREHACDGIRVEDVVAHAQSSRRSLERAFTGCLGTTPHAQIARIQLDRIKQLLAESDLTVEEVARKAGFEYAAYMGVFFKKATGQTPGAFRQAARPLNGAHRSNHQAKTTR